MKFTTIIAAAALTLAAGVAQAEDRNGIDDTPSAAAMAVDFVLVRPLGLVATVVGTGLFIAQLPFAIFRSDGVSVAAEKLVADPAEFTFHRPLGKMD